MTPPERHPSTDPPEWLNRARSNLAQAGNRLPSDLRRAGRLSPYAVATRYPGPGVPVSEEQYVEAFEIAETVVNWAAQLLEGTGTDL